MTYQISSTQVKSNEPPAANKNRPTTVSATQANVEAFAARKIVILALSGISLHLFIAYILGVKSLAADIPLLFVIFLGGVPLVYGIFKKLIQLDFGSDFLAAISIVTSILLGEYLAGSLVVLMLSGGEALERYALSSASFVLKALAARMPLTAHLRTGNEVSDIAVEDIAIGHVLQIFPHEICPVDAVVVEGHGSMDESYLTGEPFLISKAPGSEVISGAINGESVLTVQASRLPKESRYARIIKVLEDSKNKRPKFQRLGDQLGGLYTPLAVAVAVIGWILSGDPQRFLAVLVVATPCPLLIAIPVAIIGSISLSAKRGILIKDAQVLELLDVCTTMILDKTGTLTHGTPKLTDVLCCAQFSRVEVLQLAASLERYSKHPLAAPVLVVAKAEQVDLKQASEVSERPGEGLHGLVDGRKVEITSRKKLAHSHPDQLAALPVTNAGLECVVVVDSVVAGIIVFHDEPRAESLPFIEHLRPKHRFNKILLVSGDRESEVKYFAEQVGITDVYAGKSPEEKVEIVRAETKQAKTVFLGDGINDAPALMTATVGIALGQNSDIITESAHAVIMDSSLQKVDELFHIGRRMRSIALQSALGGMALSVLGMFLAIAGILTPVGGAIVQEVIDLLAVLNALRASVGPKVLSDFEEDL